jgi:hypothetical protein
MKILFDTSVVLVNLLEWTIEQCDNQLREGALVMVQEERIRVRKLPIVKV